MAFLFKIFFFFAASSILKIEKSGNAHIRVDNRWRLYYKRPWGPRRNHSFRDQYVPGSGTSRIEVRTAKRIRSTSIWVLPLVVFIIFPNRGFNIRHDYSCPKHNFHRTTDRWFGERAESINWINNISSKAATLVINTQVIKKFTSTW